MFLHVYFIDLPVKKTRAVLKCILKLDHNAEIPKPYLSIVKYYSNNTQTPFLIDFVKIELRARQAKLDRVSTV